MLGKQLGLLRGFALVAVALLFAFTVSCGDSSTTAEESGADAEVDAGFDWSLLYDLLYDFDGQSASPFYGQTLTIFVESAWQGRYRLASILRAFRVRHPGVNVVLLSEFDVDLKMLRNMIYYGVAPDIMQASMFRYPNLENPGMFSDWWPAVESHPMFLPDVWNMNTLEASKIDGRLVAFPAAKSFFLVAANRNFPFLVDYFAGREYITVSELRTLYEEHGGSGTGLRPYGVALIEYLELFELHNFFDYSERRVEFDTERFVSLITDRYAFLFGLPLNPVDGPVYSWQDSTRQTSQRFMFSFHRGMSVHIFGTLELLAFEPYFSHLLPLATDDGRLLVYTPTHTWLYLPDYAWLLGANDPFQQALAAEFLMFMAGVYGFCRSVPGVVSPFTWHQSSWMGRGIPSRFGAEQNFEAFARSQVGQWGAFRNFSEVEHVLDSLQGSLGSMPMHRIPPVPYFVRDIVRDEIPWFAEGVAPAAQVAQNIQFRVELALAERDLARRD